MMPVSFFIQILNMSLGAAWAALFVIVARLFLRRFSHSYSYALWGVVLFRLVCPVSFTSVFSLMPRPQTIPQEIVYAAKPEVESGFAVFDQAVSSLLPSAGVPAVTSSAPVAAPQVSVNPIRSWLEIGNLGWQVGMAVLLLYCLVSYLRFLGKLRGAVLTEGNVWESDRVPTAFVLGILRPKIYLPTGVGESERRFVLCHEETHIRRLDHIAKPLATVLLAVHWFNPVLWLSYFLMRRDMEMSCDELALKRLGEENRKGYTACLLSLSARQSGLAIPLAFGENDVKSRIVNILRYKKPALWGTVLAVILAGALDFCLLSNPGEESGSAPADNGSGGITLNRPVDPTPSSREDGIQGAPMAQTEEAHGLITYTPPVRRGTVSQNINTFLTNAVAGPFSETTLDYRVAKGTPVYSPISGTVLYVQNESRWPLGKVVVVQSSEESDIILWLGHLSSVDQEIKAGDKADNATLLGFAGTTGSTDHPAVSVYLQRKTEDGDQYAGIYVDQWDDTIFANWPDCISDYLEPSSREPVEPEHSNEAEDQRMLMTYLLPIQGTLMGNGVWYSPQELGKWLDFFEGIYQWENRGTPSSEYGDDWPVEVVTETLSRYFEDVTADQIIASADSYDPQTNTVRRREERTLRPGMLTVHGWVWAYSSPSPPWIPTEERLGIDYVISLGGSDGENVARRLYIKVLTDGSFRYLSNEEAVLGTDGVSYYPSDLDPEQQRELLGWEVTP